jgi:hypothetical protein
MRWLIVKPNMQSSDTSIYTISAAGNANYGDEIILRLWNQAYLSHYSGVHVISDVLSPKLVETSWCPDKSRITFTNMMWQIVVSHTRPFWKKFVLEKCLPQSWFKNIMDPGHPVWSDEARRLLQELENYCAPRNVRVFHLLGGGYITAQWPSHYMLLGVACVIARRIGARVVVTGQGLMPASNRTLESMAQYSDVIDIMDCRDEPSWAIMSDCMGKEKTSLSGDDTLLFFSKYAGAWRPRVFEQRALVVSIQNDLFNGDTLSKTILTSSYLKNVMQDLALDSLVFLPCMGNDITDVDVDVLSELNVNRDGMYRFQLEDVLLNGFPYYPNGYYITSRYHPHLLASLMGGRGCAFYDTEYYRIKHESVSVLRDNPWPLIDANMGINGASKALGMPAQEINAHKWSKCGMACLIKKTEMAETVERLIFGW